MSFASTLGITTDSFPKTFVLGNGHEITLHDEDGGYLADSGHGVSNPWVGVEPYLDATADGAWMRIAVRFCSAQPAKGEVRAMAEKLRAVGLVAK